MRKIPNIVSFYFKDPLLYEKVREIAQRERISVSALLANLMEEYVRRHEPCNPQKPMDPFFEPREPGSVVIPSKGIESVRLCDRCAKPAEYLVHMWRSSEEHQTEHLCADHFAAVKKKPWYNFSWKHL